MDKRLQVNAASGESSGDGGKSKEMALEKLRKMEWKRNSQDSWHLARSNSRGSEVQEKKKYNKNEDNYFEGTGVQKTKKYRRPRQLEGSSTAPPGFCVAQASPSAPPVNAWAQKKGSALFQSADEGDEEDQVLKLVLQESLKSAEEDQKRRMERLKMTNLDQPESSQTMCAEKDWDEELRNEEFHTKPQLGGFQGNSPKEDLHFVDTDDTEETQTLNQRQRSSRTKKASPQKFSASTSGNENDLPKYEEKVPFPTINNNIRSKERISVSPRVFGNELDNDVLETSHPDKKYSTPIHNEPNHSLTTYVAPSNTISGHMSSVIQTKRIVEDTSSSFDTKLTFGDTQGLFEKMCEDNEFKKTNSNQKLKDETLSPVESTNPCEPSETDILLHSFIRHEPPSNLNSFVPSSVPSLSENNQSESNSFYSLPSSQNYSPQNLNPVQSYLTHQMGNTEQRPMMNGFFSATLPGGIQITNDKNSCPSLSGSPIQNVTPFGSLENDPPSNSRVGGVQVPSIGNLPYMYPYGVASQEILTRQMQAMQIMNQNVASATNTDYSVTTPIRGMVPANPQVGQPQFRLPNSNMMMPQFQGQNMSSLLMQQQLQQVHLQQAQLPQGYLPHVMALDAARLHQSQLATGVAESGDTTKKEQVNMNQSMAQNSHLFLGQNPTQILPHNQSHLLQLQHQPQSLTSVETSTSKQGEPLQSQAPQGMKAQSSGVDVGELTIEYMNAVQYCKQLQERIQGANVQPPVAIAQTQPAWGVNTAMPMAVNQYYPLGMMPQVHPQMVQQTQNSGLVSPSVQNTPQNLPGFMNIGLQGNLGSETQIQSSTENMIGRGRGRIH